MYRSVPLHHKNTVLRCSRLLQMTSASLI